MIKLLDLKTGCTNIIKRKFIGDTGFLDTTSNSLETLIFSKNEVTDKVGLRSFGYYRVKQITSQHYFELKPLHMLCKEFNKLTGTLKTEEQQSTDPYPWLAEDDERRSVTEKYWRNILIW